MTKIIIIAAISENNVIGFKGKIPWHIPEDFKRFKAITLNHPVIMGRKTFESLPIKPLPKRVNIVLTRDLNYSQPGVIVKHSLLDAIDYCKKELNPDISNEIYICGGNSVYSEALKIADSLDITKVHKEYEGDTFFPKIDEKTWDLYSKEDHEDYSFQIYERINQNY